MISSRNAVFNALLQQVTNPAFATTSRRFRMYQNVPPEEQPALFLRAGPQRASEDRTFGLIKWTLKAWFFIYCLHNPDSQNPGLSLMDLIDIVEKSMAPPQPGQLQTLGGLVTNAYIDGETAIDEGYLPDDVQSVAVIPITIVTGVDGGVY